MHLKYFSICALTAGIEAAKPTRYDVNGQRVKIGKYSFIFDETPNLRQYEPVTPEMLNGGYWGLAKKIYNHYGGFRKARGYVGGDFICLGNSYMLHNFLSTQESTGNESWEELPITDTAPNGRQRLCDHEICYDNVDDFRYTLEYSISDTKCDHSHFYIRKGVHNLIKNLLTPVDSVDVIKEEHEGEPTDAPTEAPTEAPAETDAPASTEDLLLVYPDKLSEKLTHANFDQACNNGATSYPEIYKTQAPPGDYHFAKSFCESMGLTLPTPRDSMEMDALSTYGMKIQAMWLDAFRTGEGDEDFSWYYNPTCYDDGTEFEESEEDEEPPCVKTNEGETINYYQSWPWYPGKDNDGNPEAPSNRKSEAEQPQGHENPVHRWMPQVNGRVSELNPARPVLCHHRYDIYVPGFVYNEYCLYNVAKLRYQTHAASALKLNVDKRNPISSNPPRERYSGYVMNDFNSLVLYPAVCHATLADGTKVDYYGNVASHGEGTDGWEANLCYYITDEHYDNNTNEGMVYTSDSYDYINLDVSGRVWPLEPYQQIGQDCIAWMGAPSNDKSYWVDHFCHMGVNVVCEKRTMC